jgi:peptidoglycan/LPS O-acetylase OafA/YrhL
VNLTSLFALPLWLAMVYFIVRSKRKGRTIQLALGSMFLSFLLMFLLISVIPALDTHAFGVAMGFVSLLVGTITALLCNR